MLLVQFQLGVGSKLGVTGTCPADSTLAAGTPRNDNNALLRAIAAPRVLPFALETMVSEVLKGSLKLIYEKYLSLATLIFFKPNPAGNLNILYNIQKLFEFILYDY
jgi:hypothetical protein